MFDHDYNPEEIPTLEDNSFHQESYNDLMGGPIVESHAMPNVHQYLLQDDPLRHANAIQFPSLSTHYVEPHHVSSYIKSNGTFVEGYLRDGDGNTSSFDGDGYIKS